MSSAYRAENGVYVEGIGRPFWSRDHQWVPQ
jgi:hypothetical protein